MKTGPSLLERAAHALSRPMRRARYKKLKARLGEIADPGAVFSEIYDANLWDDAESRSGAGSTMAYTTNVRAHLPRLLRARGVAAFLDAPCGDFHWMRSVDLDGIAYIGGDIVPALIADMTRRYGGPGRTFRVLDITRDPLPDADLWMCRDCFFHLSYADIARALGGFAQSRIPYLLLTTHIPGPAVRNRDIVTGDARPLDLFADPFGFPAPLDRFDDWIPPYAPREMGLWSREQIAPVAARMLSAFAPGESR